MSSVRTAINEHEDGQFQRSARLARDFGRDDRISPCITDRLNALVGAGAAEFELAPVEGRFASRSKATLRRLTWYDDVITSAWQRKTLYDIVTMGFSLSYVPWMRTSNEWRPLRPIHWEADNVEWSEHEQRFIAHTLDGPIAVDPSDPNWFLCEPGGDRTWMSGGVRALGHPYLMRTWDYRDWARYNERHGLPIIVIKEPVGMLDGEEAEGFYGGVKRMGSTGIVRAPQGTDENNSFGLDLLEAKSRSYDSFDKFLDRLNVAIAIFVKGQNLTTEVQGGAYASTGWHMRVRADYAKNDADALSEAIRTHFLQPWGQFNVGSWDDDIAGWPTWKLDIPEDQGQRATALKTGVDTLAIAAKLTVPVDLEALAEDLGVPLKKGQPMPETAKQAETGTEDETDDDSEEPSPPEDNQARNLLRLLSGAPINTNSGFVDGQLFVDAMVNEASAQAEELLQPTLQAVLEELDAATDFDDLSDRLRKRYATLSTAEVTDLAYRVKVMAELAGTAAVNQDA